MIAVKELVQKKLPNEYKSRFKTEIKEIEKQGANAYWQQLYNEDHKYDTNNNGLVLPWILGMTDVDPLKSDHQYTRSTDWPDIDVDCLPTARDRIKEYAAEKYGKDKVCSVGLWQTYKFRSALQDSVRGVGGNVKEIMDITKQLPDDVDDLKDGGFAKCTECKTKHNEHKCPECGSTEIDGITFGKVIEDHEELKKYYGEHPKEVNLAVRMIGKIKALGKHAGGLIISDRVLFGNVPMGVSNGHWTSLWTEGRSTQLSKFGYIKWDMLGLKTLQYIHECCKLINKTRNYKFNVIPWKGMDPWENCLGYYWDNNGVKHKVRMDDEKTFEMMNAIRTDTVFQFDTALQKKILENGVNSFYDLQIFNAMGHPGPLPMIDEYVARRDNEDYDWKSEEHPDVASLLKDTKGIIVYQEQLQKIWQHLAKFTAPEAESARKAVAKKWTEKLKPVEEKWVRGASKIMGERRAKDYWGKMKTFGRYAFNKCLDKDTILEDPTNGNTITVEELFESKSSFKLESYCDDGFVVDDVDEIIECGEQDIYEIELDNGAIQKVTLNHKFRCDDGKYWTVKEIIEGNYSIVVRP